MRNAKQQLKQKASLSFLALAFALVCALALAGCGGGGGGGATSNLSDRQPGNISPTPVTPVSVLGHNINVIHLEKTDLHSTSRNFPQTIPVQGTDLRVDGNGPSIRNITCPGVPPRGNECTITHYTFPGAGGVRYAAREHPNVPLDRSIDYVIQNELDNLKPANAIHGIQMYESDVTGTGIQHASTTSYGGFGQWMSFHVFGPSPDFADLVFNGGGIFTIGATSFGNLYVDPTGDSRPKGSANYEGAMVGREHDFLGAKAVQGKSNVVYNFSVSASTVDVLLSEIVYKDTLTPAHDENVQWLNIPVNKDASFFIPGHGNHTDSQNPHPSRGYVDGDFYGPQGQEVAGVFETERMVGAFGGKRGQ